MSIVVKDLGAVSAYAYAVEKGYTGTEAEFAELMADYAEVGQRAEDAAESALNSKTAAQTAATTATNKASEATTAAQTATTKAGEAQTSAQTASTKASEASQSASQASGYAQTAETAKTDAQTAKTQADTARDEAVTAKTAAETAQGKAEDAQAAAESVAESIPSDYSQLSEDVSDLKEEINDETTEVQAVTELTADTWINNSGTAEAQNGYSLTGYIDLSNAINFKISGMTASDYIYYCYYNDSYDPVGAKTRTHNNATETIPNGVKYVRVTCATGNFSVGKILLTKYTRITLIEQATEGLDDIKTVNPTSFITDFMLRPSTDELLSSDKFVCTDYLDLPFEEGKPFKMAGTFSGIGGAVIYDADKTKLLGIDGNNVASYGGTSGNTIQTIEVPYQSGMRYIRISGWKALVGTDVTKLGVVGKTFAGVYPRIFDTEKKVYANISDSISKSKVLVIGDSISTDSYGNYPKWVTNLIKKGFLPYDTNNSSQHATGFVARYNNQPNDFITRIKAVSNPSQYGLVVVFGGINDYIQNIPMGSESGTDYTVSFKPAVNEFFAYLIENFVQARICVLLPLRTSTTTRNTAGEYQQAYSDYIKQVAKSYCLPILNLTEESGFYPYVDSFKDMWTLLPSGYTSHDGVHPTEEYEAKYLTPMIRHFLQGLM